jgi:hypothetical protein
MRSKRSKLYQHAGCVDCKKDCIFRGNKAAEETEGEKFGCNSSKIKIV